MHNPAPVLENDTYKLLWDFNIQTDHLIPARRPDLIIINNTDYYLTDGVMVIVVGNGHGDMSSNPKRD